MPARSFRTFGKVDNWRTVKKKRGGRHPMSCSEEEGH